jgi:hypothetical protein
MIKNWGYKPYIQLYIGSLEVQNWASEEVQRSEIVRDIALSCLSFLKWEAMRPIYLVRPGFNYLFFSFIGLTLKKHQMKEHD